MRLPQIAVNSSEDIDMFGEDDEGDGDDEDDEDDDDDDLEL